MPTPPNLATVLPAFGFATCLSVNVFASFANGVLQSLSLAVLYLPLNGPAIGGSVEVRRAPSSTREARPLSKRAATRHDETICHNPSMPPNRVRMISDRRFFTVNPVISLPNSGAMGDGTREIPTNTGTWDFHNRSLVKREKAPPARSGAARCKCFLILHRVS